MSGIAVHRSRHTQHYVVVSNALARDVRLSFRARGLLVMLLSLPPDWHVTTDMLAEDNPDSRTAIRSAMAELRQAGYVEVHTARDHRGRLTRRIEVFDTDATERGQAALGLSSAEADRTRAGRAWSEQGKRESPQVAPSAPHPAAGGPAAGIPAVIKKYRTEVQAEVQDESTGAAPPRSLREHDGPANPENPGAQQPPIEVHHQSQATDRNARASDPGPPDPATEEGTEAIRARQANALAAWQREHEASGNGTSSSHAAGTGGSAALGELKPCAGGCGGYASAGYDLCRACARATAAP